MDVTFDIGVFFSLLIAISAYVFRREAKRNQIRFAIISELSNIRNSSSKDVEILTKNHIEKISNLGLDLNGRVIIDNVAKVGIIPSLSSPTDHYENFFTSLYILPDDEVQSIIEAYDSLANYNYLYFKSERLQKKGV